MNHLRPPTSVLCTPDWTSLESDLCSSCSSSSSLFVFCSLRMEPSRWESWVLKPLLDRANRAEGSSGQQVALQAEQRTSRGLEKQAEQKQLEENKNSLKIRFTWRFLSFKNIKSHFICSTDTFVRFQITELHWPDGCRGRSCVRCWEWLFRLADSRTFYLQEKKHRQ